MDQSKSLTFFLLLAILCAAAVSLQSDGVRWRDLPRDVRIEAHDDSIAIREDAAGLRDSAKAAPLEVKQIWGSLRYNVTELHAAAKAETRVAEAEISPGPRE